MRAIPVRRLVQAACLALFLAFLAWPAALSPGDFSFSLLPSAGAGLLAARALRFSLVFFLAFLVSGLFLGRAFCGWACPLGTLADVLDLVSGRPPRVLGARVVKHLLAVALWAAAAMGFSAFWLLDPLGWAARLLGAVPPVRPDLPGLLAVSLAFAGLSLALGQRGFCRVICPAGATLGWMARLSPLARRVAGECEGCGRCVSACPGSALGPDPATRAPAECLQCRECVRNCPRGAVSFGYGAAPDASPDPVRRRALAFLALSAGAGAFLARAQPAPAGPPLIRPPGAAPEDRFADLCIRCGSCVRACPTGGIVQAGPGTGARPFQTPVLSGRAGGCDYSCNACGSVCPTGALTHLPLERKQKTALAARAVLDPGPCLPLSRGIACVCCYAACPVHAVLLKDSGRNLPWSDRLLLPSVKPDLCIGCGLCEAACPSPGAIRILPK